MIQQLANVTIDGINTIFGGFIYALDYQQSFGEAPSQLKVTVTNSTGVFNIDPNDLDLLNHTYTIKVGTKIQLFMLLIEYTIETRPSGKLLQLSFVDNSIQFLDHIVVKLLRRQFYSGSSSYEEQIPGYYPSTNTIIIGQERQRVEWLGSGVSTQIGAQDSNQLFPIGTPGNDFNPAKSQITDVQYTFADLINLLIGILNPDALPVFNAQSLAYFNSYAGRLREVLSAWCNDLGLGFYWENNKLSFIDLTSPSTTSAVVNYFNSVVNSNQLLENTQTFSLRDTMSRGVYSFFGKDAKATIDLPSTFKEIYSFSCMQVQNIPWTDTINVTAGGASIPNPMINISEGSNVFLQEVKASYYGEQSLLVSCVSTNLSTQNFGFTLEWYRASQPPTLGEQISIDIITANTAYAAPINSQYQWYQISTPNLQIWDTLYKQRSALAHFWGSFFYLEIDSDSASQLVFDYPHAWYAAGTPLTNVTILNDVIAPLAPFIRNYTTVSLEGFLNNDPAESSDIQTTNVDFEGNIISTNAPSSTFGYAIIKINPIGQIDPDGSQRNGWSPTFDQSSTNLISINDLVIIEGDENTQPAFMWEGNNAGTSLSGFGGPSFYLGVSNQESSPTQVFNQIQLPSTNNLNIFAKSNINSINSSLFFPRLQFEGYVPPATANVNLYDINFVTITEDQIASIDDTKIVAATIGLTNDSNKKPSLQQNPQFIEWSNGYRNDQQAFMGIYANALTLNNFNDTFALFGVALTIDQKGPFFSSNIVVPNIDLNIPSQLPALSVALGLQGFNITVDDKGMKTTYSIGTLKMKLKSPNVFFRYRYNDVVGNYQLVEFPSPHLQNNQY